MPALAFISAAEKNAGPFLVTGASGNVGREVLKALLARGAPVRAALRGSRKANADALGCETVHFDFEDPSSYAPALKGIKGLFLMRPNPVLAVKKTLNRVLDVAAEQGVTHCVFLSVAGAEKNSLVPHHAVEQHLMRGPLRWTLLRAGFFMQNLSGPYREDIREGTLVLPAGSGKVAYVDAQDLGEVAALALREPAAHSGRGYHLTGMESLSFDRVAALLTLELGRAVQYRAATLWGYWRHCRRRRIGIVPTLAYTMIHAALRGGSGAAIDSKLSDLLGRPPRTLRQFVEENRSVWA